MQEAEDPNEPFNITRTEIACPFHDGVTLPIEIGWVIASGPVIHLNAPEVLAHLRKYHEHN